jgi:hypothetical protein
MRIAWFRPSRPDAADPLDESAPVLAALAERHQIDLVTEARAHDFVWMHFRRPYDRFVYELGHTPAHRFMQAYLRHYPGIVAPRGLGVPAPLAPGSQPEPGSGSRLRLGVLDAAQATAVGRAVERARANGAAVDLLTGSPPDVLREAHAICAVEWPPREGSTTAALLGMAAGKPVVVLEVEGTAGWPALDPQTWRARGVDDRPPIVVSVDPRDEEHSLMLAFARLAADAGLRAALGAAGAAWWRTHATLEHAVEAWERMLAEEPAAAPHARRPADHSEGLRDTLADFGVSVDFLDLQPAVFDLRSDQSPETAALRPESGDRRP